MLTESHDLGHEGVPRPIEPIPEELARRLLAGTMATGASVVYEGDKTTIYRCFERGERIPGVADARLRVDYRIWNDPSLKKSDQVRFEYTQNRDGQDRLVAEMHLGVIKPGKFMLGHRYVQPELQGKNIGTDLYRQVEDWLGQVAEERREDVTIGLQTGQVGVIAWARKPGMDFKIRQDGRELLAEIQEHPDHFDIADLVDDDELERLGFIFRKGVTGRTLHDAVRLTFEKTIKVPE